VRAEASHVRYVVCNADEGEPGTFKDREVMRRRPDLLVQGLAIAAFVVGAREVIVYLRGELKQERAALLAEIAHAGRLLGDISFHLESGHGAYICGEETALLEALEGKRGMPRLKPPYPTHSGFRGEPTLIHNVETLACVPSIVVRGGPWFRALGRTEPGTKLYCVSGHVKQPGVYELPLGVCLDELVAAAGGYEGEPQAFVPGGAASGFLPMSLSTLPLDYGSLAKVASMLGSAGVVVLNQSVDLAEAALWQARFFEDESCGQCAPCRIGTQVVRRAIETYLAGGDPTALDPLDDVAWEMEEGSICGLGMTAAKPLISARAHFPAAFGRRAPAPTGRKMQQEQT
jgi:NADH:ubiquinone oxidoreductase subunit F (NADH-binding)